MYMQQPHDDMLVIQQILQGHTHAYATLVDRYQPYVFTLVLRYVSDRGLAEELAQDVFIKAYRCLADFKGGSRFSTWLYTIVHTTCLSHLRKRGSNTVLLEQGQMPALAADEQPADRLLQKTRQVVIEKAVALLAAEDAEIITLYYMAEQSLEEVGRVLGITAGNAKVKLHRARQKLRAVLETKFKNELV